MAQLKAPPFKFEHRAFEDVTPISFAKFRHSRHFAGPPPDWQRPSFQTKRAMSPSGTFRTWSDISLESGMNRQPPKADVHWRCRSS
jgi:hypothetical protein